HRRVSNQARPANPPGTGEGCPPGPVKTYSLVRNPDAASLARIAPGGQSPGPHRSLPMNFARAVTSAASLGGALCLTLAPQALARPGQAASGVDQVCAGTLGLRPGEKHFAACVASLSSSLSGLQAGRDIEGARRACLARGLTPGAPAFDECELTGADRATRE